MKLVAQETTKERTKRFFRCTATTLSRKTAVNGAFRARTRRSSRSTPTRQMRGVQPARCHRRSPRHQPWLGQGQQPFIDNQATTRSGNGWKIQKTDKSHFHVEGGDNRIYWLQDPDHAQHPVPMGWADNRYALKSDNLRQIQPATWH